MKQLKLFLFGILTLTITSTFGQIPKYIFNENTEDRYNPKDFTINSKLATQRIGVYHFGDSEAEWDFIIIQNGDSLIVQTRNYYWGIDNVTKKETWLNKWKTYNSAYLKENKIYFHKFVGLFADYSEGNKTTKALLLFCNPIEDKTYSKDSAEVGHYKSTIENYFGNKERYELSLNIKPDNHFASKSKNKLKILRNTIYANYGLIFQRGGEMEKYFKQKTWYQPYQKDVSNYLTEIEKKNIEKINRFQKQ